jgi:sodium-dependent phosphate cotransporter
MNVKGRGRKPPKLLKTLTDPFTKLIIQLDKSKIKAIAVGELKDQEGERFSLIKRECGNVGGNGTVGHNNTTTLLEPPKQCFHLFAGTSLKDTYVGLILLVVSLAVLVGCLICIVKLLHSLLKGKIAATIRRTINNDFPGCFGFLTGYAAILLGAIMTILVQSSSVFTSALTPLVGIGILSLERMYPLTLGANVGTTFTSVLAALASPPSRLGAALQIAFCHLLFNISGIILFFPVPFMRKAPITLAKILGNKTAKYRWVAVLYIAVMFFMLPGTIFGLSMAGTKVLMGVGLPFLVIFFGITLVNVLQSQCPKCLPKKLRNWRFLPRWLHSLKPADRFLTRIGDTLARWCPFCSSGWSICFRAPDTTAQTPSEPNLRESRKHLLLTTSPGSSAVPSRVPSRVPTRSNSPSRGRYNKKFQNGTPL